MLNNYSITTVDGDVYKITVSPDTTYKVVVNNIEAPTIIKTAASQGLRGPASTIEIGNITTLEPWEQAYVINVGTEVHAILDIGIPQGTAGNTGVQRLGDIPDVHLQGILDGDTIVWDDVNNIWIPGNGLKTIYVVASQTGMGYTQEEINALPAFNTFDDLVVARNEQNFRGFAYILADNDFNIVHYHTGKVVQTTQLLNAPYIAGSRNENKAILITDDGIEDVNTIGFVLYPTTEIDTTSYAGKTHTVDVNLCNAFLYCQNWVDMSMDSIYIKSSTRSIYTFSYYSESDGIGGITNVRWKGCGGLALQLLQSSSNDGGWGNDAQIDQYGGFRRYSLSSDEYTYLQNIPQTIIELLEAGVDKYRILDLDATNLIINKNGLSEVELNRSVFIPNTLNQMIVSFESTFWDRIGGALPLGQITPCRISIINTTTQPIILKQNINSNGYSASSSFTPRGKQNVNNYTLHQDFINDLSNIYSYLYSNPSEWFDCIVQEESSQYYINAIQDEDISTFTFYKDKIYVDTQNYLSWINGKLDTTQINGVNNISGSLLKFLSEKGSFVTPVASDLSFDTMAKTTIQIANTIPNITFPDAVQSPHHFSIPYDDAYKVFRLGSVDGAVEAVIDNTASERPVYITNSGTPTLYNIELSVLNKTINGLSSITLPPNTFICIVLSHDYSDVRVISSNRPELVYGYVLAEPANANIQSHISSTSNPHNVTKTQVGLSNVDNVQQLPLSYLDTDGALTANSDVKVPSQKAAKTYIDGMLSSANALVYKGTVDCSSNPNYPAADSGWLYLVSIAGKIGGASGIAVEAGDMLICTTDGTISGNQATVGSYWNIIQKNIDGYVNGPASSTDGYIPLFDGTTGKLLKNSSYDPTTFETKTVVAGKQVYHGIEQAGTPTWSANVFTLPRTSGAIKYWYKGTQVNITANDITLALTPTNNTLYFVYFQDATGVLTSSTTAWDLYEHVCVATVFYNGTTASLFDERHSYKRDSIAWHKWAHSTIGTRYQSGLGLSGIGGSGTGVTWTLGSGTIQDEDISINIPQVTQAGGARKFRDTSASTITFEDTAYPFFWSGTNAQYVNASYTLATFPSNQYINVFVYATSDISKPFWFYTPPISAPYTSAANARAVAPPSLSGLSYNQEMKLIWRLVISGGASPAIQAVTTADDYRTSSTVPSGGTSSPSASSVTYNPTAPDTSSNVQAALDYLNINKLSITAIKIPFYTSAGTLDTISLTSDSKLPFYNASSVAKNIPLTT